MYINVHKHTGLKKKSIRKVPGSPVFRTHSHFHCQGWVKSPVGELRFYMPHSTARKKKEFCKGLMNVKGFHK